ncbi:hypothetical protein LINPERHAP1_LOCUS35090, partial [Linum perenne]
QICRFSHVHLLGILLTLGDPLLVEYISGELPHKLALSRLLIEPPLMPPIKVMSYLHLPCIITISPSASLVMLQCHFALNKPNLLGVWFKFS